MSRGCDLKIFVCYMKISLENHMVINPIVLEHGNIRLEPLGWQHILGVQQAVQDGELWTLRVTSAHEPENVATYINQALRTADRFAIAVIDKTTQQLLGTTSYHKYH